jgi:hypothetical protein
MFWNKKEANMVNKFEDQLAYNFNKLLQVRDPDQFNVPNKFLRPVAYQIWTWRLLNQF